MFRNSLVCAALALSCGGVTALDSDAGAPDSGNRCSSGARICGGSCGGVSDCAGGCTSLIADDGVPSTYGVCFSDLPDKGTTSCAVCDAGQGCIQRAPGEFVCVPLALCQTLRSLGANGLCWFGDKTAYDGSTIPAAGSCPDATVKDYLCGGGCGSCKPSLALDRCIGQGPDHPFGICAVWGNAPSDPNDTAGFPKCAIGAAQVSCPPSSASYPYACAIYPGDLVVADANGICIERSACLGLAAALPGGLDCYDDSGNKLNP